MTINGDSPSRRSVLTTLDLYRLELACQPVWRAFGTNTAGSTYLVGTAQTGGEYRDVDVRTILPDAEFDALFGSPATNGRELWSLMCAAIGRMLADQTDLPIDYQIQRMTQANEKYQGQRNPIGTGHRRYAGGGDATAFPTRQPNGRTWDELVRDNEQMWNAMQRACNKPESWNETLSAALDAFREYEAPFSEDEVEG